MFAKRTGESSIAAASGGLLVRPMQYDQISVLNATVRRVMCAVCISTLLAGACVDAPGGESDVPCTVVPEWASETIRFRSDGNTLLITENTSKMVHQAILRFDPIASTFYPATEADWGNADGEIECACLSVFEEGPFVHTGNALSYNGLVVKTAAESIVRMSPSLPIPSEFVAVLTTNGRVGSFNRSSGQHYHQVFSAATGHEYGEALKVGVGGMDNGGVGCGWVGGNRFVAYQETLNIVDPVGIRLCIVEVQEINGR